MAKRFLLEGESDHKIWVAVLFQEEEVCIQLHLFNKEKTEQSSFDSWLQGGKLAKADEVITRTVSDENLLPEEIKVKNVGKVRQIEIEWSNMLIQTRLLQSFNAELVVIKESIAALNEYSQELFDDCSSFWERLLNFRKDHSISNEKLDAYKLEIDVLFEVLKSLRKDSRKEFDEQSIVHFEKLTKSLDEVEESFKDNPNQGKIVNQLKEIRASFNASPIRKSHRANIDKRINDCFEKISSIRKKKQLGNVSKRISDLEGIIEKMQKGIDWENRQLAKMEKDKQYADHQFQVKLIDTKIDLIHNNLKERKTKLDDITKTYNKLKKQNEA